MARDVTDDVDRLPIAIAQDEERPVRDPRVDLCHNLSLSWTRPPGFGDRPLRSLRCGQAPRWRRIAMLATEAEGGSALGGRPRCCR